jgi:hypothetical protein
MQAPRTTAIFSKMRCKGNAVIHPNDDNVVYKHSEGSNGGGRGEYATKEKLAQTATEFQGRLHNVPDCLVSNMINLINNFRLEIQDQLPSSSFFSEMSSDGVEVQGRPIDLAGIAKIYGQVSAAMDCIVTPSPSIDSQDDSKERARKQKEQARKQKRAMIIGVLTILVILGGIFVDMFYKK